MGLFSRKPKAPEYDPADCAAKKKRLREIFNETVEDGDSYEVLYACMYSSQFEEGFVFDTNTTTFYFYVMGYRRSDFRIVLIQVDSALENHSEAVFLDMDSIVNVSYDPKIRKACLEYRKDYGRFGELLDIGGTSSKTMYGPKNIHQPEEKERFLDFLEAFRARLEQKGYKLDKWKR